MEPITSGYGEHAATVVSAGDGRIYLLWVEDGAMKGSLHRATDRALIAGPWDTNLVDLEPTDRIDGDDVALPGNKLGIVLEVARADDLQTYLSADGRHFSPA